MLIRMAHTTVLVLGFVLVPLALFACGKESQIADISTPETRVVAKATVKASPQAASTPTPALKLIATPTPTPSEPLYSEDFEDGPAQNWSLEPGWQVSKENGNTVLLGRGHYWANLTRGADWTDYVLKFRLKVRSAAVHLNYRMGANPFSRYFLSFSKEGLTLTKQVGDDFTEMMDNRNSYHLNTWHTVEIKGFAGHLQVLVDGVLELDLTDEEPLLQGTIAFESLPGSEALIDDIEIWRLTELLTAPMPPATPATELIATPTVGSTSAAAPTPTHKAIPTQTHARIPSIPRSLAGSITDLSSKWIDPNSMHNYTYQDRDEVPLVSRITVSAPDGSGNISITGAPGAIPSVVAKTGKDWLRVASIDWGTETCVQYGSDGSFSTQLSAGPGSTIMLGATSLDSCRGQWIESTATALVRVSEGVDHAASSIPFSISSKNWSAAGEMDGESPYIAIATTDGFGQACFLPRLHVYRLFDKEGEYAGQVNLNAHGPPMTPSGLPIETDQGAAGYWALVKLAIPGMAVAEQCMQSEARYELRGWTSILPAGWYRSRLVFYVLEPDGSESMDSSMELRIEGIETGTGIGYLPLVSVGNAQMPRIPATLLNESPSWGSGGIRGIVAREDEGRFALGSRRAAQGPFIASLQDPLSGRTDAYLMEPFFPTLAYTGFVKMQPQIPLLPLDESALGEISVSLTGPDGQVTVLANKVSLTQSFISGSDFNSYPVQSSFAGPGRTYGVTTGLEALEVTFDHYGLHTVSLEGELRTIWGQELSVNGSYDIWVAEPLDLSLGTFEGTPLEVGDEWSPVVVVEPGVPADIEIEIEHFPDGDRAKKQTFRVSGKANRFGYFVAEGNWRPDIHGEYILRVTARYTDPVVGTLWMGTRSGASIVATPDTSLIAHGERNGRLANIAGDNTLRTWFFTRTFDPECGEAACDEIGNPEARSVGSYPYFRGDVAWLADMSPIGPSITLEDPMGILDTAAPQVAGKFTWCSATYCADAADMKKLSMHTADGSGGQHRPDAIDSKAYWYTSTIRPDISVHHTVSEVRSEHNHWYGHDTYNCQIGLTCFETWDSEGLGERSGDEEGDIKLFFGGAVIKNGSVHIFVPYASMGVVVPQAIRDKSGSYSLSDPKGNRICPPYQGAAGGLAPCGPLLTIEDREVDLFVTPTGTRPGSVLEVGDTFIFSGQVWPTLDVAVEVTVTSPSGQVHLFSDRASPIGYIDSRDKTFVVSESGVYTVHVSLTQDRAVPSTGLAPDPPLVADGQTALSEYGYSTPLSAILGSMDSRYHFFVAEPWDDITADTEITLGWGGLPVPSSVAVTFHLPDGAESLRYTVTIPGLLIRDVEIAGSPSAVTVELDQDELYVQGYTNVVLGADSMEITLAGTIDGRWFAKPLNLRGVSPLGGEPATIR